MITIAVVEMDDNSDTYNFTYAASEDQATVYPGKLTQYITVSPGPKGCPLPFRFIISGVFVSIVATLFQPKSEYEN